MTVRIACLVPSVTERLFALGLGDVRRVLLSSEPCRLAARDLDAARALCPNARACHVDGELLSWYGPRTAAGLAYLRRLAGDG